METLTAMGFSPPSFGWVNSPGEVAKAMQDMQDEHGRPPVYSVMCQELDQWEEDDNEDVLLWEAEKKVFGQIQPSWDQDGVGTCVSFGWARGANDLLLRLVANGKIDKIGFDVATEPIYGGSRVEVGGGSIRGDGSIGAWAARWVKEWGVLLRKVYDVSGQKFDLTTYSPSLSRSWGSRGVPDVLEPEARLYPVKSVVLVTEVDEAWKLLGTGRPIPICSGMGFDSPLKEGFCAPRGSWPHCMVIRGRVMAMRNGTLVKAFPCQNSWGDYLRGRGDPFYVDRHGNKIPLPPGCFLMDEKAFQRILNERDSFCIDDVGGFKPRKPFDWLM